MTRPNSVEQVRKSRIDYQAYLARERARFPSEAFAFAASDWHYDHEDHRGLHDSWLKALTISEEPVEGISQRATRMTIVLLGPFHDGETTIDYDGVSGYRITSWKKSDVAATVTKGHGDWLVDEVLVTEPGTLTHEIHFSTGTKLEIECRNIRHRTTAPATSFNPPLPSRNDIQ